MKLHINGKPKVIDREVANLRRLLEQLAINPNSVVVEHNEGVIPRGKLETVELKEGDRVEIVHFVGGGAPEEEPAKPAVKPKKVRKAATKESKASSGAQNLVIVESPAKAKTINKFLGKDFQVEASFGHVRDLPKSKMGIEISRDFEPQYIVIMKARKQVKLLKQQAKGKKAIYIAADPDREGEAISWHLAHIFQEEEGHAPIQRVVFNEITKEAIQEAFRHPREISMNLVNSQQARRILDRIVGYELSPLLWRKVGRGLSAGRVQSVALRLIVDREREIKSFVPVEYWSLIAKLSKASDAANPKIFQAKLDKIGDKKAELKTGEETEKIRKEILNLPFKIDKVEKKERQRRPQAPFTTSKIQQEAYNRLGFPAARTMRIAQKLYEGVELGSEGSVGLITYMRTDSVNISVQAQNEAASYIRQKFGDKYLPEKPPVYRSKKGAQEAHEAIRPSSASREPLSIQSYLSDEEFKLYDLIWKKFLSSQMTPAVDENISISIAAGDQYFFKASGRRNLFPGFSVLYGDAFAVKEEETKDKKDEKEDAEEVFAELPELIAGEALKLHELPADQHFTKPPPRFNDASLVKTLEENGIGRPSTYAPIISTIVNREYAVRKGGALQPSELGEIVVDLLVEHFPDILGVEFTANMEEELDKIEEGTKEWVDVLKNFYGPFEVDVAAAKEKMKNFRKEVVPTEYSCTVCTKPMVIRWGRFGKFMACSGFPDCKTTRSIPTGFFCPLPDCGGELVKRRGKNRRTFYGCSNYPKCSHVANKLPQQDEPAEEEKAGGGDRTELGA